MSGEKLNETAKRQQEDRKKRLAEALRANMALRKKRTRAEQDIAIGNKDASVEGVAGKSIK